MTAPLQVLVVEDDAALRALYVELLSSDGHVVRAAADGREALGLLGDGVDMVVTDFSMPNMRGDAFVEEPRRHKDFAHLPVLVVTAFPDRLPASLAGPRTSVLRKPFRLDAFTSFVEAVARGARQR